jgi:TolB-like protein/Flp pilus assembly protein TadD
VAIFAAVAAFRGLGSRDRGIQSIAVLPFANVGANPDQEYLSDGITENVIGSLSRLPSLKVIAFGSVLRYKGTPPDVQAVARDLGVAAAVIGRVTRRGDNLSIMAELIDARDRSRLWGDQYDVKATDILAVQEEISRQLSDQLRGRLSQEEKTRLARHYTNDSEAYDLYLKGRYYWQKFTPDDYPKALEFFRKAIKKDPEFAPAYAGVAEVYASMTWEGIVPPQEGYSQIEAAVNRALSLDDTVALAHKASAHQLKFARDWNWRAAEPEFQRAIALDPQDAVIRRFYSQSLRALGRFDDAIAEMKRAKEVDPLGVETNKGLAYTYYWARRYDEAIEQCKKTLEIDPNNGGLHELLAEVYARKGMYKEAIAERQQTFLLAGYKEDAEGLGQDFEALGYEEVMRRLNQSTLDSLKESAKSGYVSPFAFAECYAKLGDGDQAFMWLDKAATERAPWVTFVKTDPDFDGLHPDPRFAALLKRIGLPL